VKSRLVVAGLALGALVVGALAFGIARANSRMSEAELQRRERLERAGRPDSVRSPTRLG
jgi:hypothetical protein